MDAEALMDPMDFKVGELLKEVKLDYSLALTKFVDDAVLAIKEAIDSIPEDIRVTADEGTGFVRDIGADKVEFKFKKPESVKIGGSYSLKCIAKPNVCVDLFILLPKECFHEKDYLNYRYHAKRFLYLCILKKYLKSSPSIQKVEWSAFQNEARKPTLLVHPVSQLVEAPAGFCVCIIPTSKSLFNISKLGFKRNNIRSLKQDGNSVPTPRYNTSILEDMTMEDNTEFLNKNFVGWRELGEAAILLKVWARQRSSIYLHDCLTGFLIAIILSYLATHEKINKFMKPMQIFRVTLGFIAKSALWSRGLYLQDKHEVEISEEERELYKELYPVLIRDTYLNLASRMSRSSFTELQEEASLALHFLEKSGDSAFEEIFLMIVDFPAKYDHCIRLNLKGVKEVNALGFCLDNECWRLYEQKVHNILLQGLGDRAKFIRIMWRNVYPDCCMENGLSVLDREPLLIGVLISSSETASRIVDIGPPADNKTEALKFRKFWGEKAELRRFKDGRISESAVWESDQWSRHVILKRIVEFLLPRHLSLSKVNIVHVVDQLDFSLVQGVSDPISVSSSLLEAFEVLSRCLRQIEDIPLKVSSVKPLDPALRFTSVFPPQPHPLANEKRAKLGKLTSSCIQPVDVMIELEGSGNWPVDNVAIEKTKNAFLLKIGESLQSNWGMTCSASEDDVDVLLFGYAFRLKILHNGLVKRESGSHKMKRVLSADVEILIRSQHASLISGLQGVFPTYGSVVRLAKRWVASHLFSACLVEEAVELLVAHLFLKPFPFSPPCSRITGFLRFLRLLSEYDWTFSSLVVDINNELSVNDKKEIQDNFMLSRKGFEDNSETISPAMFLATSYDKTSEAWTRLSPNLMELKRLVAYARSSAGLLTRLILQDQTDSYRWECLFRTPLNNYDAVVLLHGDRLPYPQRLLFSSKLSQGRLVAQGNASKAFQPFLSPANLRESFVELKSKLMVDFDPLRSYVADLEREFDVFKVWYDSLGGDAIGLTWERSSKKRERDEPSEEVEDPVEMLKSVGEFGKGFVRSVYLLKAPRIAS